MALETFRHRSPNFTGEGGVECPKFGLDFQPSRLEVALVSKRID